MAQSSASDRFESVFSAATIAAHASAKGDGFRQKDVLFLIELFSNWIETGPTGLEVNLQATQISRYLDTLVAEGYARKRKQKRYPTYKVTRTGLIELIECIVSKVYTSSREHFFFFHYFVKNYRHLIEHLVEREGRLFSAALKLELEELLNTNAFLNREIRAAEQELERLNLRIADSDATALLTRQQLKKKVPFENIVAEIKRLYPYELNSQKPLDDLLGELPPDLQQWEMESGTFFRSNEIWQPAKSQLENYITELQKLAST